MLRKELTLLEMGLIQKQFQRFAELWDEEWSVPPDLKSEVVCMDQNPIFCHSMDQEDQVVRVVLKCTIDGIVGNLQIVLTSEALSSMLKLSESPTQMTQTVASSEIAESVSHVRLSTRLFENGPSLSLTSIANLIVGECLPLRSLGESRLHLEVGGATVAAMRNMSVQSEEITLQLLAEEPPVHVWQQFQTPKEVVSFEPRTNPVRRGPRLFAEERTDGRFLEGKDLSSLLIVVANESPQTLAVVLGSLGSSVGRRLLSSLPRSVQSAVEESWATMAPVTSKRVRALESCLLHRLPDLDPSPEYSFAGRLEAEA